MQRGNGDGRHQRRRGRRAASLVGEARHGDQARALLLALVMCERVRVAAEGKRGEMRIWQMLARVRKGWASRGLVGRPGIVACRC